MSETYAAQVDADGTVTQVIVGNAAWANAHLDGDWYDTDTLVGIGWTYTDGTFTPPPAPEIDELENTFE